MYVILKVQEADMLIFNNLWKSLLQELQVNRLAFQTQTA